MTSLILFGILYSLPLHPIHVSVTEIEFDRADRSLEIMIRVFIDDLELTLRQSSNNDRIDLIGQSAKENDLLISGYLTKHFTIALDKKKRNLRYLGHEREGEAYIVYVAVDDVGTWNTILVHNDMIMSTYDDQSNLVHVYVDDEVKSVRLTSKAPSQTLSF